MSVIVTLARDDNLPRGSVCSIKVVAKIIFNLAFVKHRPVPCTQVSPLPELQIGDDEKGKRWSVAIDDVAAGAAFLDG